MLESLLLCNHSFPGGGNRVDVLGQVQDGEGSQGEVGEMRKEMQVKVFSQCWWRLSMSGLLTLLATQKPSLHTFPGRTPWSALSPGSPSERCKSMEQLSSSVYTCRVPSHSGTSGVSCLLSNPALGSCPLCCPSFLLSHCFRGPDTPARATKLLGFLWILL